MNDELLEQLRGHIPPLFLATELDAFTGNALRWRTIKNLRCQRMLPGGPQIPEECFLKHGKKTLIVRDPLLAWWSARCH